MKTRFQIASEVIRQRYPRMPEQEVSVRALTIAMRIEEKAPRFLPDVSDVEAGTNTTPGFQFRRSSVTRLTPTY